MLLVARRGRLAIIPSGVWIVKRWISAAAATTAAAVATTAAAATTVVFVTMMIEAWIIDLVSNIPLLFDNEAVGVGGGRPAFY
ncbi:hypothetical protein GGTG_01750 [Gaeumannomyces tritici R3-111a-1]|uniref:Uncharacterized protein n=1 Tax=Gaeumannomyces tritici (strain R3-111a-1) TaxID=644352 RepID=J3NKG1_GAET3|nr:hypothetical protein GGTG_01750 [Gaeumannomyces tritici R3-111a-1]EJT81775.1 hypothetical protein GGTG_01750 [Gaeumannomyces tritici R3-111a-1]